MISQRTFCGRRMDLEAPRPEMICLDDIVQGLSHCCRFAGQIFEFYSVAQHAVLVSSLVHPAYARAALHHDDSEAYMGDLSRHLKHHPALDGYRKIESELMSVINYHFNITISEGCREEIKIADNLAAIFEHWKLRDFRSWQPREAISWAIDNGFVKSNYADLFALSSRLPSFLRPAPPLEARMLYIAAHEQLI